MEVAVTVTESGFIKKIPWRNRSYSYRRFYGTLVTLGRKLILGHNQLGGIQAALPSARLSSTWFGPIQFLADARRF